MADNDNRQQPFVTYFGGPVQVKALGEGRIGGRIITFSGATDPDRVKEFFDGSTDFWLNGSGERRPILYRHGLDPAIKRRRFGELQLQKAADGIWASGFIAGKDPDSIKMLDMAHAGMLNWSTGSVGHLVVMSPVGMAKHIDEWPIAECSLCPDDLVAEPRNVVTLKSFADYDGPEFHALKVRSPYSQSTEADAHIAERVKEAEQRALNMYVQTLQWQHEQRMRELGATV
jgi:hypothetical protein